MQGLIHMNIDLLSTLGSVDGEVGDGFRDPKSEIVGDQENSEPVNKRVGKEPVIPRNMLG